MKHITYYKQPTITSPSRHPQTTPRRRSDALLSPSLIVCIYTPHSRRHPPLYTRHHLTHNPRHPILRHSNNNENQQRYLMHISITIDRFELQESEKKELLTQTKNNLRSFESFFTFLACARRSCSCCSFVLASAMARIIAGRSSVS